jgi:ACR3 family arsenite efflux pump ArsB
MKKKLLDTLKKINVKNVSGFTKRNLLIVWFVLCICVSVSVSAYLVSRVTSPDAWNVNVTHAPSTPTLTLVSDTGWWSAITTPTPKQ